MAALFTVLLGASAVLLGSYLYDFSRQIFIQETEAAIDIEIEHILEIFADKPLEERIDYIKKRSAQTSNPIYFYQDKDDKRLAGSIDSIPTDIEAISDGTIGFSVTERQHLREFGAKIHSFDDGSRLLIARDIHEITKRYERLRFFIFLILFFMLSVVLVSFFISLFVVSRINIISQTAQNIMATGDLSQRISIDSNWDDLSNLAQILNAMLARIEELMIGIKDVSDNIAHDLRTPLARLRTQLEAALKTPLTSDQVDELLKETDDLLGTFNALMRISNIEKDSKKFEFQPTSIKTVLEDVIELYDPLAEEKSVKITPHIVDLPLLSASNHLLFQMIANLLDNAVKYSPDGGEILVELLADQSKGEGTTSQIIRISDQGIGIPSSEREKVFDRFYRTDKSRFTEGSGLGLSLVKAVLALHKGDIVLKDNKPGLIVELILNQ
jgi:signal transduction histidine kinase